MMGTPIYERSNSMINIAKRLINERSDLFGKIEIDMIECGLRTDKAAPPKQKAALKIEGIKGTKTLLTDKRYLITGYASIWSELTESQKVAHMANMLIRITVPTDDDLRKCAEKGEDYEHGKINQPDIKDYKKFLAAVGLNWDAVETDPPNLLDDKTIVMHS